MKEKKNALIVNISVDVIDFCIILNVIIGDDVFLESEEKWH